MTKEQRNRVLRLVARAGMRYERRHAAVEWFWLYWKTQWQRQPQLSTKVTANMARHTPQLTTSPCRYGWVLCEDCLHLEDQAAMLLTLLAQLT